MNQPPDGEKEHEQHPIDAIQPAHMTAFPLPPTTLQILEGGFHSPPQAILSQAGSTCGTVRNDQQSFFLMRVPIGTQVGLKLFLLP